MILFKYLTNWQGKSKKTTLLDAYRSYNWLLIFIIINLESTSKKILIHRKTASLTSISGKQSFYPYSILSSLCAEIAEQKYNPPLSRHSLSFWWNMVNCSDMNFGKWYSKESSGQHSKKLLILLNQNLSKRISWKNGSIIPSLSYLDRSTNL